jgi:hypothetical protein
MDDESEAGRWLTYVELAELRGISKASATRMSFRHKWRRQAGNDGSVRVFVPASALHDKPQGSDMGRMADAIEATIAAFREQAEGERKRADRAEARADQAELRADRAEARADALRHRLEGELETARAQAQEAAQAAEALRQAEAARRAIGLLARLRAAWRRE